MIDVALVGIAVRAILGEVSFVVADVAIVVANIALVLADILVVLTDVLLVTSDVAFIFVDILLIRIAVSAVFRHVFLVLLDVFLVVLDVLLLRRGILGVGASSEQTGKCNCEHTSTDDEFCLHFSSPVEYAPGLTTTLTESNTEVTAKFRGLLMRLDLRQKAEG